ncbi:MAG: dimethyl sulfoxide reductase anchor subunit [Desulfovibrio sp.]|jgi:DMSO reductase anchor subunit|nr:dimethyl sulfoxide reductase anchor subunit [Desulfovibrio sp.]
MHEWSLFLFTLALHISAGGILSLTLVDRFGTSGARLSEASFFCVLAVTGSIFSFAHLGDIPGAYRALFNPGSSWLSREAWLVGIFVCTTALCAFQIWRKAHYRLFLSAAACFGILATFASSSVYAGAVTQKWQSANPVMEFYGAAFLLGPVLVAITRSGNGKDLNILSAVFGCGVILFVLNVGLSGGLHSGALIIARFLLVAIGIVVSHHALASAKSNKLAMLATFFLVLGEGLGRYVFFMEIE